MNTALARLAWPRVGRRAVVLVPLGSLEQHGPHLPLDTDTVIASAVAAAVADRLGENVLVAPALSYGSSGEHQAFAGTSSIGTAALRLLILELVRSMATWADRVVFVNAHGGNVTALSDAVAQLVAERHHVQWVACAGRGLDLHAGRSETSLMLYLRPASVSLALAERGNTAALAELLPDLVAHGVARVAPNGVLGDPAGATAEEGHELFDHMVNSVIDALSLGSADEGGKQSASGGTTP